MKELLLLIMSIAILMTSCKEADKPVTSSIESPIGQQIDEYFTALTQLEKFNGVLYVSHEGKDILHKAYNLKMDDVPSLSVSTESQFDVHSVSKSMLRYLFEDVRLGGEMKLEDKLSKFIPDFPRGDEITLKMLLDHQSGLPREFTDFDGLESELSVAQTIDKAKQQALIFEPGTQVQYSNIGYQILYHIIGELKGVTFAQYLKDELFDPLNMNQSGAHFGLKEMDISKLAANHERRESGIEKVANVLPDEFRQARIYSDSRDLMKLLNQFQSDPKASNMASDGIIQQSGGSDGVRAHIYADLSTKYNYVLLTNYDGIPFEQSLIDISHILNGDDYTIPKALNRQSIDLPADALPKFEGTYVFADMNYIALTVQAKDKNLILFQDGKQIASLRPETSTVFFADPKEPESFEFIKNAEGKFDLLMGWRGVKVKGVSE